MRDNPFWALLVVFVPFSLVSIGGGGSILAGIQHQAVDVQRWLADREFLNLFAISRAAPGPGMMLVTLIGWSVAGWAGAVVATLAMFVPSSLIAYVAARAWNRHRGTRWHAAIEQGLAPVAAGLILAGAVSILQLAEGGLRAWLFAGATGLALVWRPRASPLVVLGCGGLAYVATELVAGSF